MRLVCSRACLARYRAQIRARSLLFRFLPIHHLSTTLTIPTMSFVIRRAAQRAAPRVRGFAVATGKGSYREQQEAMVAHAAGAFNSFRDVTTPP